MFSPILGQVFTISTLLQNQLPPPNLVCLHPYRAYQEATSDILGWSPCLCTDYSSLAFWLTEAFSGRAYQLPEEMLGRQNKKIKRTYRGRERLRITTVSQTRHSFSKNTPWYLGTCIQQSYLIICVMHTINYFIISNGKENFLELRKCWRKISSAWHRLLWSLFSMWWATVHINYRQAG